jgi:hypothetical protein
MDLVMENTETILFSGFMISIFLLGKIGSLLGTLILFVHQVIEINLEGMSMICSPLMILFVSRISLSSHSKGGNTLGATCKMTLFLSN